MYLHELITVTCCQVNMTLITLWRSYVWLWRSQIFFYIGIPINILLESWSFGMLKSRHQKYSGAMKNNSIKWCCLYCICTCLPVQTIQCLSCCYIVFRMKPKPDGNFTHILRYKQSTALAFFSQWQNISYVCLSPWQLVTATRQLREQLCNFLIRRNMQQCFAALSHDEN